ncbi:MAG: phosphatase PAP2 family protein [Sphingomonas sp.]|uniref:phosphatase PAP2 family protein n=1 Tax=Sphingomonas sp. TaxID=28214 RepID=UPI001B0A076E|nr:phosphatase PAP2 family protein [Sphingomonas sp.]MBO9624191.1 phosphatase PAP2 family protein [Sphingomonas sp.]
MSDERSLDWPRWVWFALAGVAAVDVLWLALTPLSLAPKDIPTLVRTVLLCGVLLGGAYHFRQRPTFFMLLSGIAITLGAWPLLRILNHLTMTIPMPIADGSLAAADAAIGFDWVSYVLWMDAHPFLLRATEMAYQNLTQYSSAAFLLLLVFKGPERAREFVLLFLAAAILTIVLGMLMPARAAMAHYAPPPYLFDHVLAGKTGTECVRLLEELRSDPFHVLDLQHLPGMVSIPSFHTAMGVILIWCSRGKPLLFVLSLAINMTMIAGTPVWGAHYAIDILAGTALALGLILLFNWQAAAILAARLPQRTAPLHGV